MEIWDTAGSERFRAIVPIYYRDADAAILVFDVGNRETLKGVEYWLKLLEEKNEVCLVYLVANKIDVEEREVTKEEGQTFARERNLPYHEVSCKTGEGVDALFLALAGDLGNREPKKDSRFVF